MGAAKEIHARARAIRWYDWAEIFADLYCEIHGEASTAEAIMADAECRLQLLRHGPPDPAGIVPLPARRTDPDSAQEQTIHPATQDVSGHLTHGRTDRQAIMAGHVDGHIDSPWSLRSTMAARPSENGKIGRRG
jgi:hypothetical protein